MLNSYVWIQVSSPETEGSTRGMTGNQREFRVVDVFRIKEVAIIASDIIHEMTDVCLEDLWLTEENK